MAFPEQSDIAEDSQLSIQEYHSRVMAAAFSVGVDADPMLVEATIDKTLDEIIQERRTKDKGGNRAATPSAWVVCWGGYKHLFLLFFCVVFLCTMRLGARSTR